MPTSLSLSKLVDLALGTPEVGAVNFNVLHTLLHAMIARLNIGDVKADINDQDRDFLSSHKVQRMITGLSDIDSGKGEDSEDGLSESRDVSEADTPGSSASYKPKRPVPYHHLELRVEKLAEMLDNLNSLPSNSDLFERTKAKGDGERPVSDMWQYMQMKKRVDANEEGVGKLMSLIEDVMKEMQILRDANAALQDANASLQDANAALQDANKSIQDRVNNMNFDELNKKLADLENLTNDLKNQFSSLPEDLAQFVTWPLLEDALKGVRTDLESLRDAQAEPRKPVSRPTSGRPMSGLSTASSGPTSELLDVLERLGKLSDSHEALKKRVDELEAQLKNKVDKETLENLMKQLERLQKQMDEQKAVVIRQVVSTRSPAPLKVVSPEPQMTQEPAKLPDLPEAVMSPKRVMSPEVVKSEESPDIQSPEQVKSPERGMSPQAVRSPEPPEPIESPEPVKSPETINLPRAVQDTSQPLPDETSFVFIPESQVKQEPEPELNLPEIEAKPEPQPVETTSIPPFAPQEPVAIKQIEQVVVHAPGLGLTGDLLDQLNKLKEDLDLLKTMKDEDHDALNRAQQAILALQAELENLQKTTQSIIAENTQRSKQIENLLGYCDTLQEKKADKDYVAMEVDVKADKRQLDGKVNHSLFDTTTNEINKLIKDILAKLDGSENSWKDAYKALADDLEGKLDRLELDPLKEWLESRLKALNKKIMANANADWTEDDAAGLRKQLLQRFNCLSCDRPVDLLPTGPVPSLPSQNGLPPTRSPRPYTTFELDQIRQHAKSFINPEVSDYYATSRQCGGNHTLTFPHKRVSRMTQMNNLFKEEVVETAPAAVFPLYKEEVDVQGVDGHIYRGRIERVQIEAKMPSKMTKPRSEQPPMSPSGPRPGRKIQYMDQDQTRTQTPPPINSKARPMSALSSAPRPGSGRASSRPQSTRPMSARLSGQESSRTTPYQEEPNIPQDSAGADPDATLMDSEAIRVSVPTPDVTEEPSEQQEHAP